MSGGNSDSSPHDPDDLNPGELFARALEGIHRPRGDATAWEPLAVEELQQRLPDYEILGLIGRGGMGVVYKARQLSLDRLVAIKVLPRGMSDDDPQYRARFQREARAMAQLQHPGIVTVFDAGTTSSGLLYFVMEYITGTDVQQLVKARGRLEPAEALRITAAVCDALGYAHEHGIIHRDIKPSNVMLDARGSVKVADFGLAKSSAPEITMLTGSNVAMGTPDFMAPEALKGVANVDQRADLYAVGVMLYQMLTGDLPRGRFVPPSRAVSGLDKRLDLIVDKALQTEPAARYSTAIEVKAAIEPVLTKIAKRSGAQGGARPPGALPRSQSPGALPHGEDRSVPGGHAPPGRPLLLAVAVLAVLCVVAWIAFGKKETPPAGAGHTAKAEQSSPALQRVEPSAAAGRPGGLKPATPLPATLPAQPAAKWIAVDFARDLVTNRGEKAKVLGGQLHIARPHSDAILSKVFHNSAQRISFVWREDTDMIKLNTGFQSGSYDNVHCGTLNLARSGGQFWQIARYPGTNVSLNGTNTVTPTLKPGDAVVFQFATIGDRHFAWLNGKLLGSVTHPTAPEGGLLAIVSYEVLIDRYEYIDLDGIPEAEALKLLGIKNP